MPVQSLQGTVFLRLSSLENAFAKARASRSSYPLPIYSATHDIGFK